MSGSREGLGAENSVAMIDDSRHMQFLMRVDVSNDVRFFWVCGHPNISFPAAHVGSCFEDAGTGQSWDRMVMPFLGHSSTFEAKPRRRAFPDDRQVQGKTHLGSIGMRVKSHREALRHQPSKWSIGVRVKPPENWHQSYDWRC